MATCGSQFETGDQINKEAFWRSGFQKCQNAPCTSTRIDDADKETNQQGKRRRRAIQSKDYPAGCRMNGDGCGTTVFTCQECGWKTSFQHDDAAEPYYYETRFYRETPPPPTPPHPWSGIVLQQWYFDYDIPINIRFQLGKYALTPMDLSEMSLPRCKALGLKDDEARQVLQAIHETATKLKEKGLKPAAGKY